MPRFYLAALLIANLLLLLPAGQSLRVGSALLLITFLPGFGWAMHLPATIAPSLLFRWTIAAAVNTIFTLLTTLLLYYLPGPIALWQFAVCLNLVAILPLFRRIGQWPSPSSFPRGRVGLASSSEEGEASFKVSEGLSGAFSGETVFSLSSLLLILLIALFLRAANLHYSEFQGDEALAMISAAEALEGHEDALFLRSKGPGEVLLPMAVWRLSGVINEATARLPFTIAALWSIVTIYLIGQTIGGARLGWLAAAFFSLNGFSVAFGRIVQYQALVLWFSSLAFLLLLYWQQTRQRRFAFLSGLCLGVGLLAHYDAILVLPALGWLFLMPMPTTDRRPPPGGEQDKTVHSPQPTPYETRFPNLQSLTSTLPSLLLFLLGLLLTILPFYLPYSLDPQADRTGAYVSGRIGNELRNHLPDFFHFNSFYSSFYYIAFTSLLVCGLLLTLLGCKRWGRWLIAPLGLAVLGVIVRPGLLATPTLDLSFVPFALLLAGAFFALPLAANARQAIIAWLAVPFLGYNFVVALGLTHIYTTVPTWSLLAAMAWNHFSIINRRSVDRPPSPHLPISLSPYLQSLISNYQLPLTIFFLLSPLFLWNAFVRHDVEYWQDYPSGNLSFFWSPYKEPPEAGFFGFVHRAGWKAVGQKIATGELSGDYGSNEEPDVTTWYTRGTPRACDPLPEYYFLAADLIDPVETPDDLINDNYGQIGQVTLPNQKKIWIMQQQPTRPGFGELDEVGLTRQFDQSATPAAFARSVRGATPLEANFVNQVQLIGYDLDTRRAQPGGRVPVTLYWQALGSLPASYQVFTHLESAAAGLIAQADGVPVCWTYPTNLWRPGQIIADQHAIAIPLDAPPGVYPLQVGLYLAETFERLDVLDEAGNPAGTSLVLEEVEIKGEIGN